MLLQDLRVSRRHRSQLRCERWNREREREGATREPEDERAGPFRRRRVEHPHPGPRRRRAKNQGQKVPMGNSQCKAYIGTI